MKCELFNDNFQNFKRYNIPKAQLVIADIPYNIGNNFYGSNPMWYKGGDNKNGETQKPVLLLKRLIEIFTDPGDVVIDPVAGSGTTLRAAVELDRKAYGFEISKEFYRRAKNEMLNIQFLPTALNF